MGALGALCLIAAAGAVFVVLAARSRMSGERREALRFWNEGDYAAVYAVSSAQLEDTPLDYFSLTLRGFSAYQLAMAQINNTDVMNYLDECVWSLRRALLLREGQNNPGIHYVLGKAYYYKGESWADSAVTCLEAARTARYPAQDIPEYLGLAYASIHEYWKSVEAFSEALAGPAAARRAGGAEEGTGVSDLLLLNIAKSYLNLDEKEAAKAYLMQCLATSRDYTVKSGAQLLLGGILAGEGDIRGAEEQYRALLAESGEQAEARFQLGELYALTGDATRARYEWRQANLLDPAFEPARARLKLNTM